MAVATEMNQGGFMLYRVIWMTVAVVLAVMGISLRSDAPIAAFGAGAIAAYCLVGAIRGRCLGGICMPTAATDENVPKKEEAGRE
ncbi:hypothetical protein OIU93_01955 [Paeniglutamicibacter sp. ZC-3]|nr:hypothetical protein [Paeniglutamicibacter sp. ZC-3]MCV9993060.1 hypothetical protein [Paeniglutamicibacter sp. ZC-3]